MQVKIPYIECLGILPTQTRHYDTWKIPQNYQQHLHQVSSPKMGGISWPLYMHVANFCWFTHCLRCRYTHCGCASFFCFTKPSVVPHFDVESICAWQMGSFPDLSRNGKNMKECFPRCWHGNISNIKGGPCNKEGFGCVFLQGFFGSPNHQWLEIPWFLGLCHMFLKTK